MPSYYYTKFQKNPCVGRNERCPLISYQTGFGKMALSADKQVLLVLVITADLLSAFFLQSVYFY